MSLRRDPDRQLVSAEGIEQYFELVATQTDRVRLLDLGLTTDGLPGMIAVVSPGCRV